MVGMGEAWLIPLLPLAAFAILLLFRHQLPRQGDWVAILAIFGAFVVFLFVAAAALDALGTGGFPGRAGLDWVAFEGFRIRLGFYVDQLALVMLLVVSFVGFLIQVYSVGYMRGDAHYGWFFTAMSLFAFAMLLLVLADNLLLLYAGWELVGLCSYLLIGFYYERRSAAEAAKKAFVTTRIGDVGLMIGLILLWRATGTFDLQEVFRQAQAGVMSDPYLTAATLLVFMGAVGKSAQFPLHVWLPDAMEGPTPVSALIHAATMVVAGVYLVARAMPLFELAPGALEVVTAVGLLTALMAATMGLVMTDVKRVVAYSTINSLGLMMVGLGAGSVTAALLYLFAHAFFKALLFMASGSVIHATDRMDAQEMGGLGRRMPLTAALFGLGALAMAGFFPLAGFWAKDEILLASLRHQHPLVFALLLASVPLTALYMARLWILVFAGEPRDRHAYEHAHEAPPVMGAPNLVLALFAVIAGFVVFGAVGKALGLPGGFGEFVYFEAPEAFHADVPLAAGSAALALLGIALGLYLWGQGGRRARELARRAPALHRLFLNKYYMDDLYQWIINRAILAFSGLVAWFDRNVVNDTGVDGSAALGVYGGWRMKFLQTGRLPNYALAIVAGLVALIVAILVVGV